MWIVSLVMKHISDPYDEGISRSREFPLGFQRDRVPWRSLSLLTLPCDDWFSKCSAIRTIGVTELSLCLCNKKLRFRMCGFCEACLRWLVYMLLVFASYSSTYLDVPVRVGTGPWARAQATPSVGAVGVSVHSGAPERKCVRDIAGWAIVPFVGGMEQRKKPQPTLCECGAVASLWYYISGLFFLASRVSRVAVWEPSGTLAKKQDFLDLVSDCGAQRACFMAEVYRDCKGSNPTINLNLKGYRSWGIATHRACSQYAASINNSEYDEHQHVQFKRTWNRKPCVCGRTTTCSWRHTYVLYWKYRKRYRLWH
jgi:hypothetical protein